MHLLRRISEHPNTALRILIDPPADGGGHAEFHFMPAGQAGSEHTVTRHHARVVMGDPGLVEHFECDPPVPAEPTAPAAAAAPATGPVTGKGKKKK